jgi:HEAT repeat protein
VTRPRWRTLAAATGLAAAVTAGTPGFARALTWPDNAERVERDLAAADVATRRAAARSVGPLGALRGTPLALEAMNDPDEEVRLAGAAAAIRLRAAQATDVAVGWLNSPDVRLRRQACEVARALPSEHALAPLARSLGDPDAEVRAAAAEALGNALGNQGAPLAVPPLLGRLDDSTPAVRIAIVNALGRLGDSRAVVPLIGKIEDSAADVRQAVARTLGDLDDPRAWTALVLALRDQSTDVRREALAALGRLRAVDAVDAMAPFAADRMPSLRLAAIDALARIGTADAIRVLVGALGAGDDASSSLEPTSVREALVAAGPAAVEPLSALLSGTPTSTTAIGAAWVLGALHARAAAPVIVAAMRRGILPTAAGLQALSGAGTAAEVPVVLEFVTDSSPTVRRQALDAAFALLDPNQPDGRAVEPLAAALRDARPSAEERARIAAVLGRTGAPRAVTILAQLASAPDLGLRMAAIDALGELGASGADEPLLEALRSHEPEMRLHAAVSLAEAGGVKARDELLSRLDGGDEVDRAAVLTALGGVLARVPDDRSVTRLRGVLDFAAGPERDGIIAAVGRVDRPSGMRALAAAAGSDEPFDRMAAAILCAAHGAGSSVALATARALLADVDARVREQAAWSLGVVGDASDLPRLQAVTSDPIVAPNAAAAIARITARTNPSTDRATSLLCPLVTNPRALVRANALAGLALAHARCAEGLPERKALADDPNEQVRAAAALVTAAKSSPDDARALRRCARVDPSGFVALRCQTRWSPPGRTRATLVYIVPEGQETPRPGAAYAILLADGLVRTGIADRRGAAFDPAAPEGPLRLVSPSEHAL